MWKKVLIGGVLGVCVLWTGGLLFFISEISKNVEDVTSPSEAIVVLTGGADRVAKGVALLKEKKAKKLFISGVNHLIDVKKLSRTVDALPEELAENVVLGHVACNTRQNALETKEWMRRQEFQTLRLVTASYHMPRSLVEFHAAMPDTVILPHPVFPESVKVTEWWKYKGTAALIASEYTKYLIVRALRVFPDAPSLSLTGEKCEK